MATPDWWDAAEPDIHAAVGSFTDRVRGRIENLSPRQLVAAKNPFLFRARVQSDAELLATMMIDAFVSSSEETMFGNVLEDIAVAICHHAKGGRKSSTPNIDLEYDDGGQRTIIQVKSGPNWGNSRQRAKLVDDFRSATAVLRQGSNLQVRPVEGVCYGPSTTRELGSHIQLIGNDFWRDISDWRGTARNVLRVIGHHAGNGLTEVRDDARDRMVSHLQTEGVVTGNGRVRWGRLLALVMSKG